MIDRESELGFSLASVLISCDLGQVMPPLASISSSVKWVDSASDTRMKLQVFCELKI